MSRKSRPQTYSVAMVWMMDRIKNTHSAFFSSWLIEKSSSRIPAFLIGKEARWYIEPSLYQKIYWKYYEYPEFSWIHDTIEGRHIRTLVRIKDPNSNRNWSTYDRKSIESRYMRPWLTVRYINVKIRCSAVFRIVYKPWESCFAIYRLALACLRKKLTN